MTTPVRLKGKIAASGMALGRVSVLPDLHDAIPRTTVSDPAAEIRRVDAALARGQEQIGALLKRSNLVRELQEIFEAQQLLLDDPMLKDDISRRIQREHINGEWALAQALARFKSIMAERADPFFQDRLLDLDDVIQRVIANLLGVDEGDLRAPFVNDLPTDTILIGDEIPPSLMLRLGPNVTGIALERGGLTGHTAVLARNRGIPALVGLAGILKQASTGLSVLLNAHDGMLVLHPDETDRIRFSDFQQTTDAGENELIASPLVLADGTELALYANMDRHEDCVDPRAGFVSGTGLFRTEFLYMRDPGLLDSVDAQTETYRKILQAMQGRPVTFRLLDLGDDKSVFALGGFLSGAREPAGWIGDRRGLSFLLAHRALLESQLEAILRATARSESAQCRIMLPMVRTIEEVFEFQQILGDLREKLKSDGESPASLPVGFMVETPAAALMADVLSRHGAFLSIGSNDLAHLTLPLEGRGESESETTYYEPSVLRMIQQTVSRAAVPVSLCGEIAGIPELLPVLVGLGLREFSLALTALPRCTPTLCGLDAVDCRALAERALAAETAGEVRELVRAAASE